MKAKNLKAGTHKLKATITRQLNKLATCIAGSEIKSQQEMEEIKAILERFQGLKEKNHGNLGRVKGFVYFVSGGFVVLPKKQVKVSRF